ncbi:hypothetical protein JW992_01485 [candidate division KSB1 bacterium]|nr:hypothetical protein [candidate division KSB1 bacterium]
MIAFSDIEDAFLFVSSDQPFMNQAVVNRKTGKIVYQSEFDDIDEFPEDENDPDTIDIPHKNDLDLGRHLVSVFTAKFIPEQFAAVEQIFRHRGAYRKFKDLLDSIGKLEAWHQFEDEQTKIALRQWCSDHDLEISE